jgi:hypothetical protein
MGRIGLYPGHGLFDLVWWLLHSSGLTRCRATELGLGVVVVERMVTVAPKGTPCGWRAYGETGTRLTCQGSKDAVHILTVTLPVATKGTALCAFHSPWDVTEVDRAEVAEVEAVIYADTITHPDVPAAVEPTFQGKTAAQWQAESVECLRRREESWERSDNDGFLSQAASQAMAGEYDLCALVADNGGLWEFPAVFDLNGTLVAIHEREGEFSRYYVNAGPGGNTAPRYITPSKARSAETAKRNNERKGFRMGKVSCVPGVKLSAQWHAYAYIPASTTLKDVTVVDDGSPSGVDILAGLLRLN